MPVRIRLQRHGKKGKPFYWIVVADGRAKRDGRYLEKIGTYNPNTNPATVELDIDQAVKWLENGAQPSDTARTLLSYRGAMIKHHLNGGVKKGAFSQEEADKRFMDWLKEKQAKVQAKIDGLDKNKATDLAQRLEAEKAVNQKRIADLAAAPKSEESTETETAEEDAPAEEVKNEEAPEGKPSTEETAPAETETAQEDAHEEIPSVEESKAKDAPTEEAKNEEAPEGKPSTEETAPAETETAQEDAHEEIPSVEESKAKDAPTEEAKNEEAPEGKPSTEETAPAETETAQEDAHEEIPSVEESKAKDAPTEEEETK